MSGNAQADVDCFAVSASLLPHVVQLQVPKWHSAVVLTDHATLYLEPDLQARPQCGAADQPPGQQEWQPAPQLRQ